MPATNKLDFSNAQAAAKALKKVSTIMIRAGQPVVSSEFNDTAKRTSGITYREASLTVASGQMVVLRVNATGDIFQVLLNGAVQPLKNQTDSDKAVMEIAALLEKGQGAFQKAQARKAIALPKGMSTPAPKQAKVYAERVAQLDTQIAERQATVADLQQQLGAMTDSLEPLSTAEQDAAAKAAMLLDGIDQPQDVELTMADAYVAAREIVQADPAMMDSIATAGAIEQLKQALSVVETNAPINEAEGNLDQAKLERSLAKSFITAIAMLDSVDSDMGDSGLSELVNIALVSAADVSDIKDQNALAQLLALGLVETAEGLYMLTSKGKAALEDAGFDAYGEPFAAED
jgi:uncharacterized coiled-coil protein SlyX